MVCNIGGIATLCYWYIGRERMILVLEREVIGRGGNAIGIGGRVKGVGARGDQYWWKCIRLVWLGEQLVLVEENHMRVVGK